MRALTVRQPWAWAIVHGTKDVENRTRNVAGSYRGPVAIHAALIEDETAYYDDQIKAALGRVDDSWVLEEQLATGAFLGVVDLVGVHLPSSCARRTGGLCSWWAQPLVHHLEVRNPRPLAKPIPARGRLGLWTPEPADLEQLQRGRG